MFSKEQLETMIADHMPSIVEGMKRELVSKIEWDVQQAACRTVTDAVVAWLKENLIPDLEKQLVEGKEGLIAVGANMAQVMAEEMSAAFMKTLKEKLERSWDRKAIFKAMLD